jgi:chromosome segregation ATPase
MPRFSFRNVVQLTKKQLDKKKVEANRQLQNNNNALKKGMQVLEEEVKKAKEVVVSVAEEVKKGAKEKKALNTSLASLIAKHSQAESVLIGKQSKLDEISQKANKLIKDVSDKEKRLETLNKAIEMANAVKPDIVKLKGELKSVVDQLAKKKVDLDDIAMQEGFIKEKIDDLAKGYEEKTKPYEIELDKVKGNLANLRKKYKDEVIALEKEVSEVVSQIVKKKNNLKGLETDIAATKSIFNENADKIKVATDDLKRLEREKAIIVRDIADAKKRFDSWKLKAMEDVAKMTLKNKLEKIDKAGLKDIMNAV